MKTEHKIAIASVVVAAVAAGLSFLKPSSGVPSTNSGVLIGDGSSTGSITVIQPQQAEKRPDASPNDTKLEFIGALDGRYSLKKENGSSVDVSANFDNSSIQFILGNCAFGGPLEQKGSSWLLYVTEKDGVCSFLDEIPVGVPIARVIPIPGAMANSGRVDQFFVESVEFAIDPISGIFEWYGWNN